MPDYPSVSLEQTPHPLHPDDGAGAGDALPAVTPPTIPPPPADPRDREVLQRLADIERRLRDTQAMAARAYEAALAWPRVLEEIRAAPDYDAAYSEPTPLVSVRIATYNQSQLLCERALASLRRQTYPHWEALVVGDACDDDTEERVAAIGDGRIRFWNLPFRGPYPEDSEARWFVAGGRRRTRASARRGVAGSPRSITTTSGTTTTSRSSSGRPSRITPS